MASVQNGSDDKLKLGDVSSQTLEDVNNLKSQIRNLLATMNASESIKNAEELQLSHPVANSDQPYKPIVRMEWSADEGEDMDKSYKREHSPVNFHLPNDGHDQSAFKDSGSMDELDLMEVRVQKQTAKYAIQDDSVFFVPVLERCVFGMTLRNVTNMKLKPPSISVSLLPSSNQGLKKKQNGTFFLYNAQIKVKDMDFTELRSDTVSIPVQNTITNEELDESGIIKPGCEIYVSVDFPYPAQFFDDNEFDLMLTGSLEKKQLWSRKVSINSSFFTAASIDLVFQRHHVAILMALGNCQRCFKLENHSLKKSDDSYIGKSIKDFLLPLGYECILTQPSGIDTMLQIYTSKQPSVYWGSYFKIETFSRNLTVAHCAVSATTNEQMQYLFQQFRQWLHLERKRGDGKGPRVTDIVPSSNSVLVNRMEAEIQRIQEFQHAKSILDKQKGSGKSQKRCNNTEESIYHNWLHEYTQCAEQTDESFVKK